MKNGFLVSCLCILMSNFSPLQAAPEEQNLEEELSLLKRMDAIALHNKDAHTQIANFAINSKTDQRLFLLFALRNYMSILRSSFFSKSLSFNGQNLNTLFGERWDEYLPNFAWDHNYTLNSEIYENEFVPALKSSIEELEDAFLQAECQNSRPEDEEKGYKECLEKVILNTCVRKLQDILSTAQNKEWSYTPEAVRKFKKTERNFVEWSNAKSALFGTLSQEKRTLLRPWVFVLDVLMIAQDVRFRAFGNAWAESESKEIHSPWKRFKHRKKKPSISVLPQQLGGWILALFVQVLIADGSDQLDEANF